MKVYIECGDDLDCNQFRTSDQCEGGSGLGDEFCLTFSTSTMAQNWPWTVVTSLKE